MKDRTLSETDVQQLEGLKIHNTKAHLKVDFEAFPAACDICEKVLDN